MASGREQGVPRDQWLRFFAAHSKLARAPESVRKLRDAISSGMDLSSAVESIRMESFLSVGLDPAEGMAHLHLLPAACSQPVEGAADRVAGTGAGLGAGEGEGGGLGEQGPARPSGGGQAADGGAAAGGAADMELVQALCQFNADEDTLLDELSLTPLAFAQKRMQGQIVAQQQSQFLNSLCHLTPEKQAQYWERARAQVESAQQKHAASGGEEAGPSDREVWEAMAGELL